MQGIPTTTSQSDHLIRILPPKENESELLLLEQEVNKLSRPDKLALMERLWEELENDISFNEPPAWHQAILEERCKEWEYGKEIDQNWDEAMQELRAELNIKK